MEGNHFLWLDNTKASFSRLQAFLIFLVFRQTRSSVFSAGSLRSAAESLSRSFLQIRRGRCYELHQHIGIHIVEVLDVEAALSGFVFAELRE